MSQLRTSNYDHIFDRYICFRTEKKVAECYVCDERVMKKATAENYGVCKKV